MEKFLFTDGVNAVQELHSANELRKLLATTPDKAAVSIWLFNSSEWLSYEKFIRQFPLFKIEKPTPQNGSKGFVPDTAIIVKPAPKKKWFRRVAIYLLAASSILLVFNFTKAKWEKTESLTINAVRPDNVPVMDVDSLIQDIEITRNEKIGKNTRNNLRLRNTWPDRILLKASVSVEKNKAGNRYTAPVITIDNTTGYPLDQAVVQLITWKKNEISSLDTLHFSDVTFNGAISRKLPGSYRGDSLSISFVSIKAEAFNFCYDAGVENRSGNYNDRWFCRE
ncbi:MAG TPA: hypothetical protein P5158_10935 [Chitinophagaceae bacterium]|nr:hypothetical protein [Chitinophagaceae bacterium]MCB9056293.1 hypothetical protein [Chitinophagales bacterium]HRX94627.1 hypothetical protein [Chitinophagaceae bacterium]